MKVFISYPHTNAELAESLATRLKAEGHEVFWDRSSLPSGESFDDRIRDGIDDSDLFICLVDQDSLSDGKYARTELKFAQKKWPNPSGHVLPVALDDDVMKALPPYLTSVTVERPEGDPVAEVAAEVGRIARRPKRRMMLTARWVGILAAAGIVGSLAIRGLPSDPIQLSVGASGAFYQDSVAQGRQVLSPATDYVQLLDHALTNQTHADGEELQKLLLRDEQGPSDGETSPLPILHFRIVNNSNQTIVVDRLRLSVNESRVDSHPLLWTSSTARHTNQVLNGSFMLGNDGWGPAEDIRFTFDIVAESDVEDTRGNSTRRFVRDMPAIESGEDGVTSFWKELESFGTNIAFLRDGPHPFEEAAAMDRFADEVATLWNAVGADVGERIYAVGELSYSWGQGQHAKLAIKQQLQIVYPGPIVAPAMFATAEYDVKLRPKGKNYMVERQVAHSLDPGNAEAIDLRVWVEKSSHHDMTASIRVGEEWIDATDSLQLNYYRPIHSVWEGQQ